MKERLFYIFLWLIGATLSLRAEVVVLRSGQIVKGEIVLNNEDVVILRQKDGMRYQYPQSEVVSISSDSQQMASVDVVKEKKQKVLELGISTYGGVALIPEKGVGGTAEVQALVGAHNLLNKQIFLGGSVGYRGVFIGKEKYSWIPVQLVLDFPFGSGDSRHRPLVGGSLGYAFAANKKCGGGVCADIHVGWWYKLNESSSLSFALKAQWQQSEITIQEIIQQIPYDNQMGCNILGLGITFGVHF